MENTPNEQQSLVLLEDYLQKKSKQFTINDAAAVTGVPLLETKYSLNSLMLKYDCKLKVTENGDLIYDFGTNLHRRTERTWGEWFADIGATVWKWFMVSYKFLISIVLVVYFVVFLVIIIALVIAALSSGKSDKGSDTAGSIFGAIFRVFFEIFAWNTIMGNNTYRSRDEYGYEYDHYESRGSAVQRAVGKKNKGDSAKDKGFVASIYDFVFGPARVAQNPLANKQEVATFLRNNKGLINTAELQALAGWKREDADNFMTECLAHYNGNADISDNATLYGDFSEFVRSKDRAGEAPIVYYWDEYEAPQELTGNTNWRNFWIILMNSFNLVCSLFAFSAYQNGDIGNGLLIFLGWIPLIYSLSFYGIPFFRWVFGWGKNNYYHRLNIRKRLFKTIFQSQTSKISLINLTIAANKTGKSSPKEEILSEKLVQEVMQEVVFDLKAESYLDEKTGEFCYDFSQLDTEIADIDDIREQKREDKNLGDVIMEA